MQIESAEPIFCEFCLGDNALRKTVSGRPGLSAKAFSAGKLERPQGTLQLTLAALTLNVRSGRAAGTQFIEFVDYAARTPPVKPSLHVP